MFAATSYSTLFFIIIMIILSVIICVCFIRAVIGPRFTDRLVAANMIGIKAIIFVCLLAVFLEESFLVDVALVYAMLSFLAIVIISRIVVLRERNEKSRNIVKIEIVDRSEEEAKKK
jgi:multicomponent Na+:H+ antiporter subunit F